MKINHDKFKIMLQCGTPATSSDFSAREKEDLYVALCAKGMTRSTAYNRLFRDGFRAWELRGVDRLIRDYVAERRLPLAYLADPTKFYVHLPVKAPFVRYLKERGMSRFTCGTRFRIFNFKPWEREGVASILENYLKKSSGEGGPDDGIL